MATLAQLAMNPMVLRQQAQTQHADNQRALQMLLNHPMQLLSQTPVVCGVGSGHVTVHNVATGLAFNHADELLIGATANPIAYPNRVTVSTLGSPTRASSGPNAGNRLLATQRFGIGVGAQLWITDQQTGCTALALDWGGGQYSMFHLLPYQDAEFNFMVRAMFATSTTARAEWKNSGLRKEATQVVTASQNGGAPPVRYIMLQSMHNISAQRRMQTIGVQRNGGWEFYRQIQTGVIGNLAVHAAEMAPWRPWSEYFYHDL